MTQFAGFTFPRVIPEFHYNKRKLSDGRTVRARMRFAYHTDPSPLLPHNSVGTWFNPFPRRPDRSISFYLDSDFAPGLRWAWCDEVDGARIRHTGWFTDSYGVGDKIRGIVMRLPHGAGFLAGRSMGASMISSVDTGTIYESERDAAYAADSMADNAAAAERDRCEQEESDDGTV